MSSDVILLFYYSVVIVFLWDGSTESSNFFDVRLSLGLVVIQSFHGSLWTISA